MTTIPDTLILIARKYEYYEQSLSKRLELKGSRSQRDENALKELKEATEMMEKHIREIKKTFAYLPSFNSVNDTFIN